MSESQERTARARQLVNELDHPRPETRKAAADELVALGLDAERPLTAALQLTKDVKVRRRILLVLREIKAPKAIPALMEYVLQIPPDVPDDTRGLAMRAIVDAVEPRHARHCFDVFVDLRRDPETIVRALALEGIARLGDVRGKMFLEEAANSTDSEELVRDTASRMLATFVEADPAVTRLDEAYPRKRLSQMLASRDAYQREFGIREILRRDLEPFETFHDAVRSSHDLARQSGIIGLGRTDDRRAFELLRQLVEHSESQDHDRALALRALGAHDVPEQVDKRVYLRQLERLLNSEDVFVVAAALQAIVRIHHPDALDIVARYLGHGQVFLRDAAAEALARVAQPHDKSLVKPLADALAESGRRSQAERANRGAWPREEATFQERLLRCLNRIAEPQSPPELDAIGTVARYLAHPRDEVRREARAFLDTVAQRPGDVPEPTMKVLLEMLDSQRPGARDVVLDVLERVLPESASYAAPALSRLAYHNDVGVLKRTIALLRRCGNSSTAQQALGKLARDPRDEVASAAKDALLDGSDGQLH